MATLVSIGTGNFTTAGTWGQVDSTSLLDSETGNTALTTSYVTSSGFTPGAITIDRLCVKIASRASSPSGTISVSLEQSGSTVSGTEVTLNVSDLDSCSASGTSPAVGTNEGGWYAFKFGTPVTLLAATEYKLQAKTSSSSQVNLFRDGTAGNWARMLVTTTTAAPAASDILHVMGEHTGAGTGNSFTVTMDNTASTTFGATANTLGAFTVGKRGTLTWGVTASTAYLLKIAGPVIIFSGGTWNQGTSGSRMPSTSTGTLQFAISTNVDGGFIARNGAIVNRYGNIVTTVATLMTADKVATNTVIAVASTSGWAANDEIGFAPTSRTASQHEKKTISSVDSGTQVTLTAGLTNAHSGTSPTQAEVIHLTRNVKVIGTSTTLQAYVLYGSTAVVNDSYVEFANLGSGTTNKKGIELLTAGAGSYTAVGCVAQAFEVASSRGWNIDTNSVGNASITYCNLYRVQDYGIHVRAGAAATNTVTNCIVIGVLSSTGAAFSIGQVAMTFSDCTAAGCAWDGIVFARTSGTLSNLTAHSNSRYGMNTQTDVSDCTLDGFKIWRNSNSGLYFVGNVYRTTISNLTAFGNTTNNVLFYGWGYDLVCSGWMLSGDTTFSTTTGLQASHIAGAVDILFTSCTFGVVSGIYTAHTTDVAFASTTNFVSKMRFRNCVLASATEVSIAGARQMAFSEKHDQTAGLHKRWEKFGTAIIDTTTYRTASPAEKLTPSDASNKFTSSPKQFAIANGATATVTVYVNKSAAYNGNQPRLIVRSNAAIGIASDTVLATAVGGTGSWLTLSGTTGTVNDDGVLEVYVDCDGTAGTVSVDDWSVS